MALQKVCTTNDLKDGEGRPFTISGKPIAVFKQNGQFFAIDNTCPHMGGPLGEGLLEGEEITCPWHGWQFSIRTGAHVSIPGVKAKTYPVTVKDGEVFVDV